MLDGVIAPHVIIGTSDGLTVIGIVVVQPPKFRYKILTVPAATPVTNPELFTVAIPVFNDSHAFTAFGNKEPCNCTIPASQIDVPFGALIVGKVLTLTLTL
jgi:hypothetical protein